MRCSWYVSVAITGALTTSDALKANMSDLDKMFESEDEDDRQPTISSSHYINGHTTLSHSSIAPALGGVSMASAQQVVGPISKCKTSH